MSAAAGEGVHFQNVSLDIFTTCIPLGRGWRFWGRSVRFRWAASSLDELMPSGVPP